MARPEKVLLNEDIERALHAKRGYITLAADEMGVKYDTLRKRIDRSPTLLAVLATYRAKRVDMAELALDKAIIGGQPWAVSLVLKTLGKDRGYVEKQEVGLDGGVTVRVVYEDNHPDAGEAAPGPAAGRRRGAAVQRG